MGWMLVRQGGGVLSLGYRCVTFFVAAGGGTIGAIQLEIKRWF
jgi:hypothetical protein